MRDLLNKIFVPDPELRISLQQIKEHRAFLEFDFEVSMIDRFNNGCAPFIPKEPTFNEEANRNSVQAQPVKPKNLLAAIMGNPGNELVQEPKRLSFDEDHYNKFQREDKTANDENDPTVNRRKRQNPLGDFKFKRINEYF